MEADVMKKRTISAAQGNVRSRILTLSIVVTILLATALSGCGRNASGPDEFEKAAMREVQETASLAAGLLNVYMDARVTDMMVCSKMGGPLRDSLTMPEARPDANRILEEWLKISGAYDAILLLDKTGICLASAPAGLMNQDFSNDKAFEGAVKRKLIISDFHKSDVLVSLDPKSKGWTAAIAVPIRTEKGLEGVLLSYLKWSRLADMMAGIQVGKTGFVYVLNGQNQIIIHPVKELYGTGPRDPRINLPALDDAIRKKVPNYTYEFKNVMTGKTDIKLVGFAYPQGYGNFPGLGWTVGAGADEAEIVGGHPLFRMLFR